MEDLDEKFPFEKDNMLPVPVEAEVEQKAMSVIRETEVAKGIQEIQAPYVVAQGRPRDEHKAEQRIIQACQRFAFADGALYAYPRGGEMVRGESIRLAVEMARYWGNLMYGFRVIERRKGEALIQAYCIDLESNVKAERTFVVEHRIQKKDKSFKVLTDPRDVYEHEANYAQRRVRACILQQIPAHIRSEAVKTVHTALKAGDKSKPFADQVRDLVKAFAVEGVSKELLEKRLKHGIDLVTQDEMADYRTIYKSMKDGETKREDWFDLGASLEGGKAEELNEKLLKKDEKKKNG